ncbi:uncharacterized protein PHACADRAFT_211755 [Phanerochaete carnosa HHB-10118-sp]|uniref:Protein kinase domain-containing protein n=1 Tax=Phanerochaete carnosa (strain HHB-10118-sp) TaxID=650164 RepID=K5WQ85_PHACS|nr:uncharacterized protein PHACADRAFT_211755 [Phanerochaete carnosa HHB-10118-sp]EKM52507.1 hypothetical protein PHACADRAFT_211755 [Phanerochaete carnosa HHB-10118-sp]
MSSAASGGASTDDPVPKKQSKGDKDKDAAKTKPVSSPTTKPSFLQTIASFGSSSSTNRSSKQSGLRTSSRPQPGSIQSPTEAKSRHPAASNSMPPPPPLSTSHSSSSSPGSTPTLHNATLPPALHSKSDPTLETVSPLSPRVSVTPPQRDHSPAAHATTAGTSENIPGAGRTHHRGQSTSTIRLDGSPKGSVSSLTVGAPPMTRIISNPLPQPTSRASSPARGAGRGRAMSLSTTERPAPGGGRNRSREESGSRSARSPLHGLAMSWSTFRSTSQPNSPASVRHATADTLPPNSAGADPDAEKKFWWHLRPETPRPWFDDGEQDEQAHDAKVAAAASRDAQSVFAYQVSSGASGSATPRDRASLWHRKGSVPSEQSEGWMRTKRRIEAVTSAVLGSEVVDMALAGAHEALEIGSEVLQFAPVVGLAEAARVLLNIWNAVQLVEFNRLQCLRLAERCANILFAIKQEIEEADRLSNTGSPKADTPPGSPSKQPKLKYSPRIGGNDSPKHKGEAQLPETSSAGSVTLGLVGNQLKEPLIRLIEAFYQVLEFLNRQNRRPFLKRYLKRDEIQRDLFMCDTALNDAMYMFELGIQVRILEQVLRAEKQQQDHTNMVLDHIMHTPPYGSGQLPPYQSPRSYAAAMNISPIADSRMFSEHDARHASSGDGLLLQGIDTSQAGKSLESLGLDIAPIDDELDHHPLEAPLEPPIPSRPQIPTTVPTTEPQIHSTLAELTNWQNVHDNIRDLADLRQMLRRARDDDAEMARLLQVRPEEAPEALKALQRALEDEIAREERQRLTSVQEGSSGISGEDASVGSLQGIIDGVVGRRNSKESLEVLNANLSRRTDFVDSRRSSTSQASTSSTAARTSSGAHDTLDREFMESVKDSLVRLSFASGRSAVALSLPSWTITRYEVDLEKHVGHGSFSEVWRGRYRGRTVAVKVLQSWTPKDMFVREVHVWNALRHPNILEMVGASAIEPPSVPGTPILPWFIVSRYFRRGSIVKWLQHLSTREWQRMLDDAMGKGVLRMMHEIVLGMEYLHKSGILHGDLKCANVLVNDHRHCIISDFGQSEMKSEMHRLSGQKTLKGGTLRWQAPELMAGQSKLTHEVDIYAFAVSCYEILTKGEVPWPNANDSSIRHFILNQNLRPELPPLRSWSNQLTDIIHQCWAFEPSDRPCFTDLNVKIAALRKQYGWSGVEQLEHGESEEEQGWLDWIDELDREKGYKSPPLAPNVPLHHPDIIEVDEPSDSSGSYRTAHASTPERTTTDASSRPSSMRTSMSAPQGGAPSAVPGQAEPSSHSVPGHVPPSGPPTIYAPTPSRQSSQPLSSSDGDSAHLLDMMNSPSPEPADPRVVEMRNERRYRMILQHEFHPSLSLPLWSPSPVKVGAVGYHQKPEGAFVTLFDAFRPLDTSGGRTVGMPSLAGYGYVTVSEQKTEKRNPAQRAFDHIHGIVSRKGVSRRYASPLRTGHKTAHLFAESTLYRYVADPDLSAPRKWFHANVEQILEIYGTEHALQKEDLMLVIGTLDAADYALFVSHNHPDGEVDLEVFAKAIPGEAWGKFTTTTDLSASIGPQYSLSGENTPRVDSGSKVSLVKKPGEPWDTVLLAKLRFPTDKEEPTSL